VFKFPIGFRFNWQSESKENSQHRNMDVFINLAFLCLTIFLPQIHAFEFWNDLRVTFGKTPTGNFNRLPRNTLDAEADGWKKRSESCENGGRFSGIQWIDPKDDGVALLFDTKGHVAGFQSLAPQSEVIDPASNFKYDKVPMYRNYTMNGINYFLITVYFIQPNLICSGGLKNGNLGSESQIFFQTGPSDKYLRIGPKKRSEVATGWTRNNCFPGMGWHNFYGVEKYEETDCTEVDPTCLLYNEKDELIGFCLRYEGKVTSPRFERGSNPVVKKIFGNPPQCLLDVTERFGRRTIHVYFQNSPWEIKC